MILLSAGHNPTSQGAAWHRHTEWVEATEWVNLLHDLLTPSMSMVVPTGNLPEKVDWCNRYPGSALALEVHFNSAADHEGNPVGQGCEAIYISESGRRWSEILLNSIEHLFKPNRGAKKDWRGLYFLRQTIMPAVIIEPEFIHLYDNIKNNREEACACLTEAIKTSAMAASTPDGG